MSTEILNPDGEGYYITWILNDTTKPSAVSDDSDSTYVSTDTEDNRQTFTLSDPIDIKGADTINWVQVFYRSWAVGSRGPERMDVIERLSSTDRDQGNNQVITRGSWNEYSGIQQVEKPGGGNWLLIDLQNLEVGIEASTLEGGEELRVSKIWVVVDYTLGGPIETITRNDLGRAFLDNPINAQELVSKVENPIISKTTQDFPKILYKFGSIQILKSKFS